MELYFQYLIGNKIQDIRCQSDYKDDNVSLIIDENENKLKVNLKCNNKIRLLKCVAIIKHDYKKDDTIFSNGFQSWSDCFECDLNGSSKGIDHLPKQIKEKFAFESYGDYRFYKYHNQKGIINSHFYSYIYNDNKYILIGSMSDLNGFTMFEHHTKDNVIKIIKDVENVEVNDAYNLLDIVTIVGDENEVFDQYFDLMKIISRQQNRIIGYTSWYNYYQNINEQIILDNISSLENSAIKCDVFQIDDGFETFVGDWLDIDQTKFPNGLKSIVDKIHADEMLAGIWLAPFVCEEKSLIFKNHQDWLIKDENGQPLKAGHNWSGSYALDFENKEVQKYLKNVFDYYINDLKIDLFKLDFLYASSLMPNNGKSRGQLSYESIKLLRQLAQDKLIIGCGVPLQSGFGVFDYCRIGTDIGLDFDDKWYMKYMHRERVSTKYCIKNTIYRRNLNRRAFINDPDVFILRDNNIKLNEQQKKAILLINHLFGDVLFTSDNIKDYDLKKLEYLKSTLNSKHDQIKVKTVKNKIYITTNNTELVYLINEGRFEN